MMFVGDVVELKHKKKHDVVGKGKVNRVGKLTWRLLRLFLTSTCIFSLLDTSRALGGGVSSI